MEYTKSEFLEDLFSILNTNQIDYFVVGEYRNLPESTGNNELGIMVNPIEAHRLMSLFADLIKRFNIKIVSFYTNNNVLFYRLFCVSVNYWGLQLDLYSKGCFYQVNDFYPVELIKNDILLYRGIRVLDLRKAYTIAFLKDIVHKGWSSDTYTNAFVEEVTSNELKYRAQFTQLYGSEFVELLFQNLSLEKLFTKTAALGKIIHHKIFRNPFSIKKQLSQRIQFLRRAFYKPGYTIAFLGTDGSGKTTIIDRVKPVLNEAYRKSVYYEHLRPNLIPTIAVLLGKKNESDQPDYDPHSKKQFGVLESILRFNYYMIDYVFGYWLKVYPKKAFRSCVWIFDRYYYEYFIDPRRTRISLPRWAFTLGLISIPKPDLIICLGANPEIIHARKPEVPLQEVTRQVNELISFYKKHKNAAWIDTNCCVDRSVADTLNAISHLMENRFKSIKLP